MSNRRFRPSMAGSWFVVFCALSTACGDSAVDGANDDSGAGSAVVEGGDAGASSGRLDGSASASGLLTGTFTLDEYGDFLSPDFFGVIEVDANPPAIRRLHDGSKPTRVANGGVLYRRPCGNRVTQIMLSDASLRSQPVSPCSSNVPVFDTTSAVEFGQSALSEDGTTLAVEATYYDPALDGYPVATVVFDVASQTVVAQWTGGYAPVWMPSGRLLLASNEGLMQLDESYDNPTLLGDITDRVNNPAVSPDGTAIAFEYNQQIWGMNIDGTDATGLIIGGARLRYPAWSPDGRPVIAYLANTGGDDYEPAIFVTDIASGENAVVQLEPLLPPIHTVNGPVSWTN